MSSFDDSLTPGDDRFGDDGDGNDRSGEQPQEFNAAEFQAFLQKFINNPSSFDAQELARMAGLPNDPEQVKQLIGMLSQAMGRANAVDGVDWNVAAQQAKTEARKSNQGVTEQQRDSWRQAISIATLWLDQATEVSDLTTEPKFLTRDLWVDDAMPLFKLMSQPVADRMSAALSEHLANNSPEEFAGVMKDAARMLRNAGGAMFAMQLGQAMGKLSTQVLSGADIGLPIFTEQRAAFVPQNVDEFVTGLDIDAREAQIYLAVRELAHARLFKHSKWLRDHVVSQITNYAADISIDDSKIMDAVSNNDLTDPNKMREALESGALLGDKTEEQQKALESIETMLALIEGWVDAVTFEATRLLPKQAAIAETVRRRRATGGPAELAFGTLVGLELRPRKLREATQMWTQLGEALGTAKRDSLWDHPDMLPSAADIEYPGLLITRLQDGGDDMDAALRDLLGGN